MNIIDNDLLSIQEARVLVENSNEAQKKLSIFSQEKIDEIVNKMLDEIEGYNEELSGLSYEELDCGIYEDKIIKNRFIIKYLKNSLNKMRCVGIIKRDAESKILDVGVPMGVIVAFCSESSPVSTVIYKTIIAIKSGNSIIFNLNTKAKNTMKRTLDILIKVAEDSGIPKGSISYLSRISLNGSKELINHKYTSLIMNTGVHEMVRDINKSGKLLIFGGTGNTPAFIERTADIKKAVKDIIISKCFDNGVMAGAEQSIIVDSCVTNEVKEELEKNGGYFMTEEESNSLSKIIFNREGNFEREFLGKTPQFLAKRAGFEISSKVKLLISSEKYVSLDNLYSKEKICPVISFYIEDDWMNACEKCIELLLNEKQGHTLVIHSKDEEVIQQFILKKPVGRILVNTPGVFGSMGGTTNLFPAMTLGSGLVGRGMTSDNVSPMNLIYIRKVGYEIKKTEEFLGELSNKSGEQSTPEQVLKNILREILKEYK